jgi:hypothetical protein
MLPTVVITMAKIVSIEGGSLGLARIGEERYDEPWR